jgi:hypothetical protein
MPSKNTPFIYAHIVAQIELLAGALSKTTDPKLLEKDGRVFEDIEDCLGKVDLATLDEKMLTPIEETLALLGKSFAFYGQEESAAAHYILTLYRENVLKDRMVDPLAHKKQLEAISLLSKRQEDERNLKEIEHQLEVLSRSAPLPGSLAWKDYQSRRDDLTKKKKEIEGRLYTI